MGTSGKAHGKALSFTLDTQAGSVKDISAYVRSVDGLPPEVELGDVTGGGASGYSYKPGLMKADIKLECDFDDTTDAAWDVVKSYLSDTATRSFVYCPAGTTSGYVKISGELRIKKVSLPAKIADALIFTVEAVSDGTIAIGTN